MDFISVEISIAVCMTDDFEFVSIASCARVKIKQEQFVEHPSERTAHRTTTQRSRLRFFE
jgi:hypothetical protein